MQSTITLFFLAALSFAAVNGQLGTPQVTTTQEPLTAVVDVIGDPTASATNGSTIEEILQELNEPMSLRSRRSHDCRTAGSFGGGGGSAFNELVSNCWALVKKIMIRSGSRVDAIQVTYRYPNGQYYTAGYHGGRGGSQHTIDINIADGERIIGVFGKSGSAIDQLGFITNHGRIFGPYGGCGGGRFHVNSCYLRGIFGRSGSRIDSVGFYCSPL